MPDKQAQTEKLLQLLQPLDFSRRYYAFCDAFGPARAKSSQDPGLTRLDHERAIAETGLDFKYDTRENFYGHRESTAAGELIFNVQFARDNLEASVVLGVAGEFIGGPFHGLAARLAKREHSGFRRDPPYPRLPFADRAGLSHALEFAVGLFRDVRSVVVTQDWR